MTSYVRKEIFVRFCNAIASSDENNHVAF